MGVFTGVGARGDGLGGGVGGEWLECLGVVAGGSELGW